MAVSLPVRASTMITITLELSPEAAAGLLRFAQKVTHEDALAVLYPHVNRDIRSGQAYEIMAGFARLENALAGADVHSWPWVEGRQS
jgi:hypothetical protein